MRGDRNFKGSDSSDPSVYFLFCDESTTFPFIIILRISLTVEGFSKGCERERQREKWCAMGMLCMDAPHHFDTIFPSSLTFTRNNAEHHTIQKECYEGKFTKSNILLQSNKTTPFDFLP